MGIGVKHKAARMMCDRPPEEPSKKLSHGDWLITYWPTGKWIHKTFLEAYEQGNVMKIIEGNAVGIKEK